MNRTSIPLHLSVSHQIRRSENYGGSKKQNETKEVLGLIAFPSEKYQTKVGEVDIKTETQKETVAYRSAIEAANTLDNNNDDEQKEVSQNSKRVFEYNRL